MHFPIQTQVLKFLSLILIEQIREDKYHCNSLTALFHLHHYNFIEAFTINTNLLIKFLLKQFANLEPIKELSNEVVGKTVFLDC